MSEFRSINYCKNDTNCGLWKIGLIRRLKVQPVTVMTNEIDAAYTDYVHHFIWFLRKHMIFCYNYMF
jgi:hypothetical protein